MKFYQAYSRKYYGVFLLFTGQKEIEKNLKNLIFYGVQIQMY